MVNMDQAADIRSLPLSLLPNSTRQVLADLLNSTKVIPTDGPNRLPRDWRGLAALANITSEVESCVQGYTDKTGRVLELWTRNGTATIGNLLDSLQLLDRYDVYEDVCLDLTEHSAKNNLRIENHNPNFRITIYDDSEILTYDDRPGYKHKYDAYVLHANEDQAFVDEMKAYLADKGFEICTKDKLLPGHATQYSPIAKLISERCLRIILVFSPEFLTSHDNTFFRDYAQAIGINSRKNLMIPIMYRQCDLPAHLAVIHMLRFDTKMFCFWEKLVKTINMAKLPRIQHDDGLGMRSAHSAANFEETNFFDFQYEMMSAQRSASVEVVPTTSSPEGSINESQSTKKKSGLLTLFYKKITRKQPKKGIMVKC